MSQAVFFSTRRKSLCSPVVQLPGLALYSISLYWVPRKPNVRFILSSFFLPANSYYWWNSEVRAGTCIQNRWKQLSDSILLEWFYALYTHSTLILLITLIVGIFIRLLICASCTEYIGLKALIARNEANGNGALCILIASHKVLKRHVFKVSDSMMLLWRLNFFFLILCEEVKNTIIISAMLCLSWFILRCQHFYSTLLLYHQWKCQHSKKGK